MQCVEVDGHVAAGDFFTAGDLKLFGLGMQHDPGGKDGNEFRRHRYVVIPRGGIVEDSAAGTITVDEIDRDEVLAVWQPGNAIAALVVADRGLLPLAIFE